MPEVVKYGRCEA